jgi:hypothetical protein
VNLPSVAVGLRFLVRLVHCCVERDEGSASAMGDQRFRFSLVARKDSRLYIRSFSMRSTGTRGRVRHGNDGAAS